MLNKKRNRKKSPKWINKNLRGKKCWNNLKDLSWAQNQAKLVSSALLRDRFFSILFNPLSPSNNFIFYCRLGTFLRKHQNSQMRGFKTRKKCNSSLFNGVCEKIRLRSPPPHTTKGTTKDVLGEGSIIVSPQRCQVLSYVVVSNPPRTSSFCCLLLFSISFCVFTRKGLLILLSDVRRIQ